jgi:hypothetical protein
MKPSAGPPTVFAVVHAKARKDFVDSHADVARFATKSSAGKTAGLPEGYDVLFEHAEVSELVLSANGWRRLLCTYPRVLRSLHFTDDSSLAAL